MGSLPNLKDLSDVDYPLKLYGCGFKLGKGLKSPEGVSVATSTCGKHTRSRSRSPSISPRHRLVKHVRSVDLNFYHAVKRQGDIRQTTTGAGGFSLGICMDRKLPQFSVKRLNCSAQKVTNEVSGACFTFITSKLSRSYMYISYIV